ncbi:MAG: hypothetical protein R3B70_08705 [Polyangiaceae bacterium]
MKLRRSGGTVGPKVMTGAPRPVHWNVSEPASGTPPSAVEAAGAGWASACAVSTPGRTVAEPAGPPVEPSLELLEQAMKAVTGAIERSRAVVRERMSGGMSTQHASRPGTGAPDWHVACERGSQSALHRRGKKA